MSKLIKCIICRTNPGEGLEAKPTLTVNGKPHNIDFGVEIEVPEGVVDAARNSDLFTVEVLDEGKASAKPEAAQSDDGSPAGDGNGDGAAEAPGGESSGGTDSFDPEAIIKGTVGDVEAALAGLNLEQLALVRAAEVDREKPRTGVLNAIDNFVNKEG